MGIKRIYEDAGMIQRNTGRTTERARVAPVCEDGLAVSCERAVIPRASAEQREPGTICRWVPGLVLLSRT